MDIKYNRGNTMDEIFDVVVCGGGIAGVMSAVSAAREGKNVIIIEKYGYFGGMACSALVYPFMRDTQMPDKKPANAGLYFEMLEKVYELGGSDAPHSRHFLDEYLKIALDRMISEAGVKVLFHSRLCGAAAEDGRITSVSVATVSGMREIKGRMFIDATGNADLCAFAGFPFELGRESDGLCQPMTLCFRILNVDMERFDPKEAQSKYKEFRQKGKIKNPREDILYFRYPINGVLHLNTTRVSGKNPTSVEEVSAAEMELREQMLEMVRFLRENVAGMENCELISSGTEAGIRESRRIVGRVKITAEDLCSAKKFEDSIARGTYEIDLHNPTGGGTTHIGVPKNDYYTIPYRAMLPVCAKNLIVAGRTISATHEATAAIRIMPICACMGQAAGIATAIAVDNGVGVAEISVDELRQKLVSAGALV